MKWLGGMLRCSLVLLLAAGTAMTQAKHRDPLTDSEIDQMREAADNPDKRIELLVKFNRERMFQIESFQAEGNTAANNKQVHDLLQDFIAILDEADDNIEMYASHNADMRKGLKLLIEADSEWQLKLRQLKEKSPPEQLRQYSFALTNAVDTVADSAKSSRETLQEQNKLAAEKKLTKDYSLRKD